MKHARTSLKSWRRSALPLVGACAALVLLATPAAADYYQGLRAFDKKAYTEALTNWRDSANKGDARSQFRLGIMFENGTGVRKDFVRAYFWYALAKKGGNVDAGLAAQLLKNKMKKAQVAEADRMIAGFRPGARNQVATRVPPNSRPDTKVDPDRPNTPPNGRPDAKVDPDRPEATPSGSLAGLVAGKELRRTIRGYSGMRYDIWKFSPSGAVRGSFTETQNSASISAYNTQGSDIGRWAIEGNALCITWSKWMGARKTCYEVVKGRGLNDWTLKNMSSGRAWNAKIA